MALKSDTMPSTGLIAFLVTEKEESQKNFPFISRGTLSINIFWNSKIVYKTFAKLSEKRARRGLQRPIKRHVLLT